MPKIVDKSLQRRTIAQSALASFIDQGVGKFSLSAFLKAQSIPKGRFYHYFASKDALLFESVQLLAEQYINRFSEQVNWQQDLATKLTVAHEFYLEACPDHQKKQQFVFDVSSHFIRHESEDVQQFNRELYRSIFDIVQSIIEDEISKKRIKPESTGLVPSIVATTDGLLMQSLIMQEVDLRQSLLEYFTNLQQILSVEQS